jgi:hypothetical protein
MNRMSPRAWNVLAPLAAAWLALSFSAAGCARPDAPAFSADSVLVHVDRQLAFGPRVAGSAARDAAARYIATTLERHGATVRVQSFEIPDPYSGRPLRITNVIGSFGAERTKRLMLASHFDSRPWADQEPDTSLWSTPIPGAVDGGVSTGILLEIARLAGARAPGGPGLDLVFFDGEDYGRENDPGNYLIGSRHFAANLAGYRPVAAILLDMVGGKGTRVRREGFSAQESPALLDHVFARARELGLPYFEDRAGPPMLDDHVPLLQAGMDAINLFGYDYAAWHTLADDRSQCDPALIDQAGRLLRDLIYRFDYP